MFECKDLLTLPSMAQAKIIAGKSGLSNSIRWVYKPENMNFAKWVKGQELLIISTPVIQSEDFNLSLVIKKANKLNMSGALLLTGDKYIASIDSSVVSYANLNNFPIFVISGEIPLVDIFEEIGHAKVIGITGHIRPDGDCVGSTLGLYNYIRKNLPECEVTVYLEKPSDEFNYLSGINDIKHEAEDKHFDLFVVLDCSSMDRIEPFMSCFENADKTICIDHHISNNSFADVNYVEPQSSSACEVLYTTFDEDKVDKNVAECIYTGIIHDTGVFKYSCTSRRTMDIAGKMMEMGIDYSDIIDNSFYKKSYIQNQILGRALLESVLFYDGRCIFSSVSIEEMNFYGVTGKELGGIIEQLRLTDGVEVAIFLYETDKDEYKVSLRSKKMIDVARIATAFGGGGHVRAAGFSAKGNVHSIVNKIGEMIEQQYNEDNA